MWQTGHRRLSCSCGADCCCWCCWKPGPVASPLQPFACGWVVQRNSLCARLLLSGDVDEHCLCACVCLLCIGQLSDLGLRATVHSFHYNPADLLCPLFPLTSSISRPSMRPRSILAPYKKTARDGGLFEWPWELTASLYVLILTQTQPLSDG